MSIITKTQSAWEACSKRLGFDFVGPFEVDCNGRKIRYHGFVPQFGCPRGTVFIISERFSEDTRSLSSAAKEGGFFFSCISAAVYASDDDAVFVETLTDWGWFGDAGSRPHWLRGEPNLPTSSADSHVDD